MPPPIESENFDPYYRWLGIPPKDHPPNHYRLLGLELFEQNQEVIRDAAERQIGHVRRYQLGQHMALSQKVLNELAAAKACLSDQERKAAYDAALRTKPEDVTGDGGQVAGAREQGPGPREPGGAPEGGLVAVVVPNLQSPIPADTWLAARIAGRTPHLSGRKPPPWRMAALVAGGATAAIIALVVILSIRTQYGTVKIELSDPKANVEVNVDGDTIDIAGLQEPLRIKAGPHDLTVTSGDFETAAQSFTVRRGEEQLVRVTLVPKAKENGRAAATKSPLLPEEGRGEGRPGGGNLKADGGSIATSSPIPNPPPPVPLPAIAPFDNKRAKEHQAVWAKHLGVPVEIANSIGMKLALIPPGEFEMGSSPEEVAWATEEAKKYNLPQLFLDKVPTETPRHRVKITTPFYIGMYAVTQGEYEKLTGVNPSGFVERQMSASAFDPPLPDWYKKERPGDAQKVTGTDTSRHPVETVGWDEAMEFCHKLSEAPAERAARRVYRLPTEAEWEYACRAGTTTRWYCGDDGAGLVDVAWLGNNSGGMTHSVGGRKPNAWGLCDMHGNVFQWCGDWFGAGYYSQSPPSDPAGPPSGSKRVLRGGDWSVGPLWCRCAFRNNVGPASRQRAFGFRVVAAVVAGANAKTGRAGSALVVPVPQDAGVAEGGSPAATPALRKKQRGAREVRRFEGLKIFVNSVAFSPDGRKAVSGPYFSDSTGKGDAIRVWDVETGKEFCQCDAKCGNIWRVAFSPDSRYVLSAGGVTHHNLSLWDAATGALVREFDGHTGWVGNAVFSPDGKRVLSAGVQDHTVRLWDAESGREIRRFQGHDGPVWGVAFSPDGQFALSGSFDKTVRLWHLDPGREVRRLQDHTEWVYSVAYSPDGRHALSAGGEPGDKGKDFAIRLWDLESGTVVRRLEGHKRCVYKVGYSPDGSRALSSANDGCILWDVEAGGQIQRIPFDAGIAFSPDGRRALFSRQGENAFSLWELPPPNASPGTAPGTGASLVRTPSPEPAERLERRTVPSRTVQPGGRLAARKPMTSARTWTDAAGTYTVEAEFVDLMDGNVWLRRGDRKILTIPLDKLSESDREWVKLAAEQRALATAKRAVEQLDSPTQMEFVDTPLSDVIEYIRDLHGVGVQLDKKALEGAGVGLTTLVTYSCRGISLRSALRHFLGGLGLACSPGDRGLFITDEKTAAGLRLTQAYRIDDLPGFKDNPKLAARSLIQAVTVLLKANKLLAEGDASRRAAEDQPDFSLIATPADSPTSLTLRHQYRSHEEVAGLLAALRRLGAGDVREARWGLACGPGSNPCYLRISEQLRMPTQLDFRSTPLSDAAGYLADLHGVSIQLEKKALAAAGIKADTPITASLKGMTLCQALPLVLGQAKVTYTIANEAILITTAEGARRHPVTRLYALPKGATEAEAEGLITRITASIAPESWGFVAGGVSAQRGAPGGPRGSGGLAAVYLAVPLLVITQTHEVHRQVEELLAGVSPQNAPSPQQQTRPGSAAPPPQAAPKQKSPVPDAAAMERARKAADAVFAAEIEEARISADKFALARRLLAHALDQTRGTARQYALMVMAKDRAVDAKDAETAFQVADQMAETFEVDQFAIKIDILTGWARNARTSDARKWAVEQMLLVGDEAVDAGNLEAARELGKLATSKSSGLRDKNLTQKLTAYRQRLTEAGKDAEGLQDAQAALAKDSKDPKANLAFGQYLCFTIGDWKNGLPLLALGSDGALKGLADRELTLPLTQPNEQVALADGWWEVASTCRRSQTNSIRIHAGRWYRQAALALPPGLARNNIEKRLKEVSKLRSQVPAPPPAIAPFGEKKAKRYQQRWAECLGMPVEITNAAGMKLALIPPGEFDMGATPEEIQWALEDGKGNNEPPFTYEQVPSEAPRHRVKITKPFYLGVYPVTQGEYENVMGVNPSNFTTKQAGASRFNAPLTQKEIAEREELVRRIAGMDTNRCPVETVTWEEAAEFCRKLPAMPAERAARRVYRLPTEAEWEYACRAGTTTRWNFGDDVAGLDNAAWYSNNAGSIPHPVGLKHPNAWGLYDMHGNVWQFCADWSSQDYYKQSPPSDPTGPPTGSSRVLRGGSWLYYRSNCRSACRYSFGPAPRKSYIGFRVVLVPSDE